MVREFRDHDGNRYAVSFYLGLITNLDTKETQKIDETKIAIPESCDMQEYQPEQKEESLIRLY